MMSTQIKSGIWDNHKRGAIGDFLKDRIKPRADLSFVSAYFTIYAYEALKSQLDGIDHLRFLFGEPQFIQSLDPDKTQTKRFQIENDALTLGNRLEQKRVARECADWLRQKADIRSITKPGFLHGKMYYINNHGVSEAIIGSSNFTVRGLGLGANGNNIELNLEVNDNRDRDDLNEQISEYKLSVFNPSAYVLDKHMAQYAKDGEQIQLFNDQKTRETYLIGMMRVNFLKRLESSIESFEITIERTINKIKDLEDKIVHFDKNRGQYVNPELDLKEREEDEDLENLDERLRVGKKLTYKLEHLDIEHWLKDLRADKKQQASKADDFELVTWLVIK